MDSQVLNSLKLSELKTWKQELENEIKTLDDELEKLEEIVERARLRYYIAEKVFMQTEKGIFETEFKQPLYELFKKAKDEYEEKSIAKNSWTSDLITLVKYIDLEIERYQ